MPASSSRAGRMRAAWRVARVEFEASIGPDELRLELEARALATRRAGETPQQHQARLIGRIEQVLRSHGAIAAGLLNDRVAAIRTARRSQDPPSVG